ncbi:MAG: single-stranded DNA-binding protein [Bauldia sp.]|nr:MAG: single-stranded DNA-binding protein [Bauldia sp.]
MLNKVILIGHLGATPEIRAGAGGKVATFSLATSERWRDKATGERRERTEWHRVVVFAEPLIEVVEKYLRKGSKVWIEGQLATRKWKDKAAIERWTTEVVLRPFRGAIELLDRTEHAPSPDPDAYGTTRDAGRPSPLAREGGARGAPGEGGDPGSMSGAGFDDDIPF